MDLAFEAAGNFGKFQKILCFLVLSVGSMSLMQSISFPFMTMRPEFLCREKANIFDSYHSCHTQDLCRNDIFEYKKNREQSLDNLNYDFDLYCDRGYFIGLIGSFFFFGGIFGSVFLSSIPDRKGRAGIYKILLACSFVLHLNMLLSISVEHILLINFFSGFVSYCMSMCTLILTEYLAQSTAGLVMSVHSAMFPLSGIFITLFFMYINHWRLLFFITSVYSLIMAIVVKIYFVESPKWLNSQNRVSESLDALRQIAEMNGNKTTFDIFLEQNSGLIKNSVSNLDEKEKKTYSIFEIFKLKSQKLNILCLSYMWTCSGFCYYGLVLNLEHLGGNIFLNSLVTFMGEVFSEIISGFMADEFGRIIVFKLSGLMGGIGFIIYEFLDSENWLRSVFIFIASFGFSGTFNLCYIYSPEVFPTSIRSTCMGFLYFISRIGALLVPSVSPYIPHNPVLFGVLSLFSTYVSFYLKETLGKVIPDDVPEEMKQTSFLSSSKKLSFNKQLSFTKGTIVSDEYFKITDF